MARPNSSPDRTKVAEPEFNKIYDVFHPTSKKFKPIYLVNKGTGCFYWFTISPKGRLGNKLVKGQGVELFFPLLSKDFPKKLIVEK